MGQKCNIYYFNVKYIFLQGHILLKVIIKTFTAQKTLVCFGTAVVK